MSILYLKTKYLNCIFFLLQFPKKLLLGCCTQVGHSVCVYVHVLPLAVFLSIFWDNTYACFFFFLNSFTPLRFAWHVTVEKPNNAGVTIINGNIYFLGTSISVLEFKTPDKMFKVLRTFALAFETLDTSLSFEDFLL